MSCFQVTVRFLSSGQTSSSKSTNGKLTIMGFDIRPRQKAPKETRRLPRVHVHNDSIQKNVHRTSFRSDTQATDSTCSGCSAKRKAATALGQRARVARCRNAKSSHVESAWISTLVR